MDTLILIWVVFGAAAVSMAKSKGRRVLPWALIGALIGPFAVLVIAVLKPLDGAAKEYL